jgi:nitrogen-specific signal transduction histidine kinase
MIEVRVGREGNSAALEVSDNDLGIPAHALPHVFERFYRSDKAHSRANGGAGLGLSIVKAICAAHKGEIKVPSQEGRGSNFRVELPLVPVFANDGATAVLRSKSEHILAFYSMTFASCVLNRRKKAVWENHHPAGPTP